MKNIMQDSTDSSENTQNTKNPLPFRIPQTEEEWKKAREEYQQNLEVAAEDDPIYSEDGWNLGSPLQ